MSDTAGGEGAAYNSTVVIVETPPQEPETPPQEPEEPQAGADEEGN
jgi:hypothetical protein